MIPPVRNSDAPPPLQRRRLEPGEGDEEISTTARRYIPFGQALKARVLPRQITVPRSACSLYENTLPKISSELLDFVDRYPLPEPLKSFILGNHMLQKEKELAHAPHWTPRPYHPLKPCRDLTEWSLYVFSTVVGRPCKACPDALVALFVHWMHLLYNNDLNNKQILNPTVWDLLAPLPEEKRTRLLQAVQASQCIPPFDPSSTRTSPGASDSYTLYSRHTVFPPILYHLLEAIKEEVGPTASAGSGHAVPSAQPLKDILEATIDPMLTASATTTFYDYFGGKLASPPSDQKALIPWVLAMAVGVLEVPRNQIHPRYVNLLVRCFKFGYFPTRPSVEDLDLLDPLPDDVQKEIRSIIPPDGSNDTSLPWHVLRALREMKGRDPRYLEPLDAASFVPDTADSSLLHQTALKYPDQPISVSALENQAQAQFRSFHLEAPPPLLPMRRTENYLRSLLEHGVSYEVSQPFRLFKATEPCSTPISVFNIPRVTDTLVAEATEHPLFVASHVPLPPHDVDLTRWGLQILAGALEKPLSEIRKPFLEMFVNWIHLLYDNDGADLLIPPKVVWELLAPLSDRRRQQLLYAIRAPLCVPEVHKKISRNRFCNPIGSRDPYLFDGSSPAFLNLVYDRHLVFPPLLDLILAALREIHHPARESGRLRIVVPARWR